MRWILLTVLFCLPIFPQITLTWDANTDSDINRYRLYQIDTNDTTLINSQGRFIAEILHPVTTYTLQSVGRDALYHAWVLTAVDDSGNESVPSNRTKFLAALPPKSPQNLKFINQCCPDSITITIEIN